MNAQIEALKKADLAKITNQEGFVRQMFRQLTAVFFSGVVAYRVYAG